MLRHWYLGGFHWKTSTLTSRAGVFHPLVKYRNTQKRQRIGIFVTYLTPLSSITFDKTYDLYLHSYRKRKCHAKDKPHQQRWSDLRCLNQLLKSLLTNTCSSSFKKNVLHLLSRTLKLKQQGKASKSVKFGKITKFPTNNNDNKLCFPPC